MKKFFLDTNFIVDLLLREDYKKESQDFLIVAMRNGARFYISYLSVANFAYIARKTERNNLYSYISTICRLFNVVRNDAEQIEFALSLGFSDFEDALQYAAAIGAGCEYIITRNKKDFEKSDLKIMSAREYMESM